MINHNIAIILYTAAGINIYEFLDLIIEAWFQQFTLLEVTAHQGLYCLEQMMLPFIVVVVYEIALILTIFYLIYQIINHDNFSIRRNNNNKKDKT